MEITGTQIHYYFICRRKLWLHSHGIKLEQDNQNVQIGNYIHEKYFKHQSREIRIGPVKLDFVDNRYRVVHEVKKSSRMQEAAAWQLKYSLFILKRHGITATGQLHIPEERKASEIKLEENDEKALEKILTEITALINTPAPSAPERIQACTKCAYFEFCFAG